MKTILACTDFSSGSRNATRYAAHLAAALDAQLVLFHAAFIQGTSLPKKEETEINAWLVLEADELKKKFKIKVRTEVRAGLPVEEILGAAKRHNSGLVVTGAKETGAGSGLVGGLVYDLMHAALFPVLAVPMDYKFEPLHEIALAIDPNSRAEFNDDALLDIAESFHSLLTLTVVASPGTRDKTLRSAALVAVEYRYAEMVHRLNVVENESLEKGLNSAMKKTDAGLLAIIPHRAHFMERMMHKTKTQKVLRNVTLPLLTLPRKK